MPETIPASDPLDYRDSEVVFGVVAPVGVDLRQLSVVLRDHLEKFRYTVNEIRLSDFLRLPQIRRKHNVSIRRPGEYARIDSLMSAGNKVREISCSERLSRRRPATSTRCSLPTPPRCGRPTFRDR